MARSRRQDDIRSFIDAPADASSVDANATTFPAWVVRCMQLVLAAVVQGPEKEAHIERITAMDKDAQAALMSVITDTMDAVGDLDFDEEEEEEEEQEQEADETGDHNAPATGGARATALDAAHA